MPLRLASLCFVTTFSLLSLARGAAAAQATAAPSSESTFAPQSPAPQNPSAPATSPTSADDRSTAQPDRTPAAQAPTPVLPPAGVIPANLSVTLTGAPLADTSFAYQQILAAIERAIAPTLRPGASIAYGTVNPWPLLPLALGAPASIDVAVTITGDDTSAPVSANVSVTLDTVTVAAVNPAVLYLSDDPEYLRQEGLVFRGDVTSGRAARLYYYHSDLGLPRDVDVVLTATVPSRVQLIGSGAGPDQDVMAVGHAVTRDFLQFERANEGIVVELSPGRPYVFRHALLLQNELIAGALDVQVLGGGPVAVSVVATPAGGRADAYLAGPRVPFDGHHRHGAFDLAAYGTVAASYSVGGPDVIAKIGAKAPSPPNINPSDDGRDYGDYGIIRKLTFTLANPTDDSHRIYLYEKPLAGSVSSSFVVDGQLKELDCVRSRQPYTVMTYQLPPHSTGATTTVTMTDGGSYYPLEFGVTDTRPNPYTPASGAPDSCSPSAIAASPPTPAASPLAASSPIANRPDAPADERRIPERPAAAPTMTQPPQTTPIPVPSATDSPATQP